MIKTVLNCSGANVTTGYLLSHFYSLEQISCDIQSLILIAGNNQWARLDQNYKQKPVRQKCYVLFFTYFPVQTHH